MPCDSQLTAGQTAEAREAEIRRALERLEQALAASQVNVVIGPTGAVAFSGWSDRDRVSDVCAYRRLTAAGSFALRCAVQRAEAASGRMVDAQAVAAGVHSHDGGRTWSAGH